MNGFLYGLALQWKLDIRSKSLLVTCYIVPLIFFLLMGGIFTSVMPEMRNTLIQSMIVMSVSMGAFIGLPPSLIETYGSDVKKVYKANGVPVYLGLVTMFLSAFVHLMISCTIILLLAPVLFDAALPLQLPLFFLALAAQSSYIRANRVSTSAFRFFALFNSAACFFLAAACPLSVAFNSRFKSRSSSCCTSPDQYCRRMITIPSDSVFVNKYFSCYTGHKMTEKVYRKKEVSYAKQ